MLSILESPFFSLGALICLTVWFGWLTFVVLKDRKYYSRLFTGSTQDGLKKVLEDLKKTLESNENKIDKLKEELNEEENRANGYLQKVGFLRFNPFSDTGGQQSFIVSLLDRKKNGIVISGLYGRNGTRWFAKKVILGKGDNIELTEEELQSINSSQ